MCKQAHTWETPKKQQKQQKPSATTPRCSRDKHDINMDKNLETVSDQWGQSRTTVKHAVSNSVVRAPASRDHFFLLQPHCTVVLLRWQEHLLACGDCFFLKRLLCTTLHMPKTPAYHCTPQITPVCRNCFFLQRPLWAVTIHGWQSTCPRRKTFWKGSFVLPWFTDNKRIHLYT